MYPLQVPAYQYNSVMTLVMKALITPPKAGRSSPSPGARGMKFQIGSGLRPAAGGRESAPGRGRGPKCLLDSEAAKSQILV